MPNEVHSHEARPHENQRCDKGARRQARQPADSMSAGATGTVARTYPDDQARERHDGKTAVNPECWQARKQLPKQGCSDQTRDKRDAPADVPFFQSEQAPDNPGDPGNSSVEQYQQCRGRTYRCTPCQRSPRRKVIPIDEHVGYSFSSDFLGTPQRELIFILTYNI